MVRMNRFFYFIDEAGHVGLSGCDLCTIEVFFFPSLPIFAGTTAVLM